MKALERQTTKWVIVALLALATVSGVGLTVPILAADEITETPRCEDWTIHRSCAEWDQTLRRDRIVARFIQSGSYKTIEGEIVTATAHLLIIDHDGQSLSIILPTKWVCNGVILTAEELFDGGPFG